MDNRLLNINGKSKDLLKLALQIAFTQDDNYTAQSWKVSATHGFMLSWFNFPNNSQTTHEPFINFPIHMSCNLTTDLIWNLLQTTSPNEFSLLKWEEHADHDGHNTVGWRVYVEDWGNVKSCHEVICAIKPVYLWYGK